MRLIRQGLTVAALLALTGGELLAQRRITGRVTEEGSGQPLAGASIQVLGTQAGTYTGENGSFSVQAPSGAVSLRVRRIGYTLRTVVVAANQSVVEVALKKDVLQLTGVVVTGQQGTLDRRNAAVATVSVSGEAVSQVQAVSLDQALQGKVVGARINMNSGAPGGGGQIQIRGVTSILGNGQPLFVVDGVIISNTAVASGANSVTAAAGTAIASGQDNATTRIGDINPNDIEDIQVLKGAAAAALYGSRATNGVVLITTKSGRTGQPRWSWNNRVGASSLLRSPGQRRFADTTAAIEAAVNNNSAQGAAIFRSVYAANGNTIPFNDYGAQLFGETAPAYSSALSVNGGSENTRYIASIGRQYDGGIANNTLANRDNARLRVEQNVTSRLSARLDLNYSRSFNKRGLSNNDNTYTSPFYNFAYTPSFLDLRTRDAQGNFPVNSLAGGGGQNSSNPFQTFEFLRNNEDVNRIIGSVNLSYQLLSSAANRLRVEYLAGIDRFDQDNQIYSPNFLQFEPNDGLLGTAVQSNFVSRQLNQRLSFNYDFSPENFPASFSTLGGITAEEQGSNQYRVQAKGLIPGIPNVNQGTQVPLQSRSLERDQAWYLQQSVLAFSDRLFLSASVRGDRSSNNGDRGKYYTFPGVSGSYRLVNLLPKVDELKFRSAWGQTGNRPLYGQRFITLATNGNIGGQNALIVNPVLGNPNVRPESKTETEFGVDLTMFNSRVAVEYTYADAAITDVLLQRPLASTSGLTNEIFNADGGKLRNRSHEANLVVIPVQTAGFTWRSATAIQRIRNRVEALPIAPFVVGSTGFGAAYGRSRIASGASTTAIWGNRPFFIRNAAGADSSVFTRDTIIGDATPNKELFFTNTFTMGRFSLNVQVDWRDGGVVSNLTNNLFDEGLNSRDYDAPSPCRGAAITREDCVIIRSGARALVDTSATATLGAYRYSKWNGGQDSRIYLQDGSFVKLREVALSYTVPTTFTRRIFGSRVTDMRLNLTGRNLAVWTDYWGGDPEVNNFGSNNVSRIVDLAPFPPSRQFFFSVDLGF